MEKDFRSADGRRSASFRYNPKINARGTTLKQTSPSSRRRSGPEGLVQPIAVRPAGKTL
jgi:hypothetical protein